MMPSETVTQPIKLRNGMLYAFSHKQYGKLGKLILPDAPGRGMQISAEAEQGDFGDPHYLRRLELLSQVIQTILEALPGDTPPMPSLESLKQRASLSQRFIHVQDASEMAQFAQTLSLQEQTLLFEVIQDNLSATMQTQDLDETYGILQRERDLRALLRTRSPQE